MGKVPRATVIITCYNLGRYLDEAVNSVLAQTMQDFEIIIIDDGSTDEYTRSLIANYQKPKTKIISTKNRGLPAARNLALAQARGRYLCCLDADDLYEPSFLGKACAVLDADPGVGFVSCWYRTFGEEKLEVKFELWELEDFLIQNRACTASLFRKNAWKKVGGYDERLVGYIDWEFWINILKHGYTCHTIKEFLFRYRVRPDSMVTKSNQPETRNVIMEIIIEKHKDIFQKSAIPVLLGKDNIIGQLLDWTRKQDAAKQWFLERNKEHEKYIRELLDAKEWFLQQLENHKAAMADQRAEIARQHELIVQQQQAITQQRESIAQQQMEIARLDKEITQMRSVIDLKDHELRSVYASKVWELGNAFKDARHSFLALVKLPVRIIRSCF